MKTLYIVRHGQTDYNKKNIVQGSGIDSDLNKIGRLQAENFYNFYKDEGFDFVYTSKLKRSIQSAELFIENGLEHRTHFGLNEINWGILEGQKSNPYQCKIFESVLNEWDKGNFDKSVENGESPSQLLERQKLILKEILDVDAEKILIVSHGRAIRSFLCLLTGVSLKNMQSFKHTNLGLYVLEQVDKERFEIVLKNNTDHLEEVLMTNYN